MTYFNKEKDKNMGTVGKIAGGHKETVDSARNILKDGGMRLTPLWQEFFLLSFVNISIQALRAEGLCLHVKTIVLPFCLTFL